MKVVVLHETGGPDKFVVEQVATPEPQAGEVRVKLKASALNRRDYWISIGLYRRIQFPCIVGSDGAGVIDAVGAGVDTGLVGQEVVIYPAREWGDNPRINGSNFRVLGMPDQGTFAEYICIPSQDWQEKPAHLSWEQAAALPLAGLTSWRAVVTQGEVETGQKVLVTGAGSGVSTFAIQWCVHLGADVYVTSGKAEKIAKAGELGALGGVNYRDEDFTKQLKKLAGGFDLIVDSAGGEAINGLIRLLNPGGRFVFFGATLGDASVGLEMALVFFKQARIQGTTMGSPAEFKAMVDFVRERQIIPVVDRVLDLDQAIEAHKLLESFEQTGKIVLRNAR